MSRVKTYMMRTLISVSENDSLDEVIRMMHKIERAVLPVVDDENNFLGTIYTKNILKNIIPEKFGFLDINKLIYEVDQAAQNLSDIKGRRVEGYMTTDLITVREDDDMDDMARIMIDNKESYIYVVNKEGKLRGYISRADLLYYLLDVGIDKNEARMS